MTSVEPRTLLVSELSFGQREHRGGVLSFLVRWRVDNPGNHHWIVDGPTLQRACPSLWSWAHSKCVLKYCSGLAGESLQVCPTRNSVNVNWTQHDVHDPHFDTNRYTLVTYLSDHPNDGALEIPSMGYKLQPRAGLSVFFSGQYFEHVVRPSQAERQAVVICFDSVADPNPRPPEQDVLMYGMP